MGLFSRKIKNPAKGTAQIVACSRHAGEGRWQNCRMQLVVHVPGNEAYTAEVHQIAPRAKWPQPGMTVPVDVDPKDRQRVKVDFDGMEDNRELARRIAEQQASAATATPETASTSTSSSTGGDDGDDRIARLERLVALRDSGALSDEEFDAEKRRILDA